MPETVVLLHGFGGTARAWDAVSARLSRQRYRPLALDLPGHGAAADQRPISFESCVSHVLERAPARFALCGYSMGGRIALHVALQAPGRVSLLVLVATGAGIEDEGERATRRAADEALARRLEQEPFERFICDWRSQPLFAADPPRVAELAVADQRRNRPHALAAVLRGVGAGQMQPLWSRLGELTMPARVLAGERDQKFRRLAERMVSLMPDAELVVVPGGHVLALESPAQVALALQAPARPRAAPAQRSV